MSLQTKTADRKSWLALFRAARPAFTVTMILSVVANLLLLVSPIYMLQIYDRVVTSGSFDALLWLTLIAIFLLAVYGAADAGRRRSLAIAGEIFEQNLAPRVFNAFEKNSETGLELDRDLSKLRLVKAQFEHGALLPWVDLPFTPLFIAILFFIHPLLGVFGLVGALIVLAIAVAAEWSTRQAGDITSSLDGEISDFTSGLSRQRSALVAMGLVTAAFRQWSAKRAKRDKFNNATGRANNGFAAAARSVRQCLQVGVLAAGANLALSQEVSLGAIVAGSIILARALGPIDQIVGGWRQTAQARRALNDLSDRITDCPDEVTAVTALPRPKPILELEQLSICAPGSQFPLTRPFSYRAGAGEILTLLGANGAGKTCLLQTLAGAWSTLDGKVLLGERSVHDWDSTDRGRFIGYVPQDVELFPGTVRENIARFSQCSDKDLFDAAAAAGANDFILSLPDSYETVVGPGGRHLSAGQRQLIGLARALFRNPVLLLLDEPTANLDTTAVLSFLETIKSASKRGTIIMCSTHDLRLVQYSHSTLVIKQGCVMAADSQKYLAALSPKKANNLEQTAK